MKHEGWTDPARVLRVTLTDTQQGLLDGYERLLSTRGAALGVVAKADLPRLRDRHVLDGLRGVAYVRSGPIDVVDLGSGSGIPGVPFAIARPDASVVLAESRRSRAAFLESVVDDLGLANIRVHLGRAETLARGFDACLARAFAPPAATWAVASALLRPGGILLYWAGERFDPARDAPSGAEVTVPEHDPLAYGGPVVIMGAR